MKNSYNDLIEQSYYFPQEGFDLQDGYLVFNGVSLKYLIQKYGTPFRLMYLPRIGDQIKKARNLFRRAIKAENYQGTYNYCYCTKTCHFHHVISKALQYDVNLETSSSFDIDLILNLFKKGKLDNSVKLVHNGYKTDEYIKKIISLQDVGFTDSTIVLDNKNELKKILALAGKKKIKIGIRKAIDEEPQSSYYTSRLGIRASEIMEFYRNQIKDKSNIELTMLHFFVDSGIKDTLYYWGEFQKSMKTYIELKKECPTLNDLNLGGGFPIRNHLGFEYDYEYMIRELVKNIKESCNAEGIKEPDIYTEFGKYTVGESGATIFSVAGTKTAKRHRAVVHHRQQFDEHHPRCLVDFRKIHFAASQQVGQRVHPRKHRRYQLRPLRLLQLGRPEPADYAAPLLVARKRTAVPRIFPHRRIPGFHQRLRRNQTLPHPVAETRHHRPRRNRQLCRLRLPHRTNRGRHVQHSGLQTLKRLSFRTQ
jgi:arginine decarboxylase